MEVGGQRHAPAAFTPGKDPVPIVQEAGWAPGPVWTGAENLAPPPGFDPQTVQPVADRYTDYVIPAPYRGHSIQSNIVMITFKERKKNMLLFNAV